MSKLKVSAFFCEDIRMEASGQPMFLGVFSPVLGVDDSPTLATNLIFVTMFFVDATIEEFQADLRITADGFPDEDAADYPFEVSKKFAKKPEMCENDEWMIVSHLDMSGLTLQRGMHIKAQLKAMEYDETISLKIS